MSKKLAVKKAISSLVYAMKPSGMNLPEGVRVLNYHSITGSLNPDDHYQMTTPVELFEMQMDFLAVNNYKVVTCGDAISMLAGRIESPRKAVCITFDDGFRDNMTFAMPVLKKYNFPAMIFLTSGLVGSSPDYLDWDDIKSMQSAALFSFGGHALSHKKLSALNADELYDEIVFSTKNLEEKLQRSIKLFAYPFGSYGSFNENVKKVLRANGYDAAFTTIAGPNKIGSDLFELKRTRISWFDDKKEFAKELAGAYDWYRLCQMIQGM